jgi:hypothetical protein
MSLWRNEMMAGDLKLFDSLGAKSARTRANSWLTMQHLSASRCARCGLGTNDGSVSSIHGLVSEGGYRWIFEAPSSSIQQCADSG